MNGRFVLAMGIASGCASGPASGSWSGECALVDPYATSDAEYAIDLGLELEQRGDELGGTGVAGWGGFDYDGELSGTVTQEVFAFDLVSVRTDDFGTYEVVFGFEAVLDGDRMTGACGVTSEGTGTLDGALSLRR